MGSSPTKNTQISFNAKNQSIIRPRAKPILPFNPNFRGTQYNVTINGVLFEVINPPDTFRTYTMDEEFI